MTESTLDDFDKAMSFGMRGTTTVNSEVSLPFLNDVAQELRAAGFGESLDAFDIPDGIFPPTEMRVTNLFGIDDAATILVAIYLGKSVGNWALGKVCNGVFEAKVKPALIRLARNLRQKTTWAPTEERPLIVKLGTWYDVDKVFILVIARASSVEELSGIAELAPQAQKLGLTWIEQHGIASPVLTFRIRHGELSTAPTLSDSVPDR